MNQSNDVPAVAQPCCLSQILLKDYLDYSLLKEYTDIAEGNQFEILGQDINSILEHLKNIESYYNFNNKQNKSEAYQ